MSKSPEENFDVSSGTLALCPSPTFVSEPATEDSDTSPYDCHGAVQDDLPDDGPANLKDNESMEQLEQVDTNCDSIEVDDENSNFELMKNDISDETEVGKDTSDVLEVSDVILISYREIDNNSVLLEKPEDPIVAGLSEENIEYGDLQTTSLSDTVSAPVFDSNQEKTESIKSSRARFEALHNDRPDDRPTPKSNRISQLFENQEIMKCESCEKSVYPLEKIELESRVYHKTCFKCSYCQCLLQ